jgi:hypothetical protein
VRADFAPSLYQALACPRPGRAWQRYEKPQAGHRLQLDVKFLERIAGTGKRLDQFTAIDDCTRNRVLKQLSMRVELTRECPIFSRDTAS